MNFFEHQDRSRRNTRRLVVLFLATVVAIVGVVTAAAWFLLDAGEVTREEKVQGLLAVSTVTTAIILFGTMFKFISLSAGGRRVAESMGGRLLTGGTTDPLEKRLLNIIEEMTLAAGISMPMVFVLDQEQGINAFAAGLGQEDAVVAVTRGTLETLNRDELQGVVAHEFSHILNGDMRLNLRLMGLLGGVMALAVIGQVLMRAGLMGGSSRKKNNGAGLAVIGLALMIIGYVGVLGGRFIQAAISRQREFLADASAVQFTRNPGGIGGALRKIKGAFSGSRVYSPEAAEARHMFFGPVSFSFLLSTHPPLDERIKRVEGEGALLEARPTASTMGRSFVHADGVALAGFAGDVGVTETPVSAPIASPTSLTARLPKDLGRALDSPLGAVSLTCALLLDPDERKREVQLQAFSKVAHSLLLRETKILAQRLGSVERSLRLPLLDLAVPGLRQLSRDQYRNLEDCIRALSDADQETSLFEFCVKRIVDQRVGSVKRPAEARTRRMSPEAAQICTVALLAALCIQGHADRKTGEQAFAAVLRKLKWPEATLPAAGSFDWKSLETALDRLGSTPLKARQLVLDACSFCIHFDRKVTLEELELLRVISLALGLPMPPVSGASAA